MSVADSPDPIDEINAMLSDLDGSLSTTSSIADATAVTTISYDISDLPYDSFDQPITPLQLLSKSRTYLLDPCTDAVFRTIWPLHDIGWNNINGMYTLLQQITSWTCRQPCIIFDGKNKHIPLNQRTKPITKIDFLDSVALNEGDRNLAKLVTGLLDYSDVDCLLCLARREGDVEAQIINQIHLPDLLAFLDKHPAYKTRISEQLWLTYLSDYFLLSVDELIKLCPELEDTEASDVTRLLLFWIVSKFDTESELKCGSIQSIWHKIKEAYPVEKLDLSERNMITLLESPGIDHQIAIRMAIISVIQNPDRQGDYLTRAKVPRTNAWKDAARNELQWWINPASKKTEYAFFFQRLWLHWLPNTNMPTTVPNLWRGRSRFAEGSITSLMELRVDAEWTCNEERWVPVPPVKTDNRRVIERIIATAEEAIKNGLGVCCGVRYK